MATHHKLIIGNSADMGDIESESIQLVVTSPPYFNAPFDYQNLFSNYDDYLNLLEAVADESFRVLQHGRIFALNIDDMLVDGEKYPITADAIKIFQKKGFRYRDRLIWKKPDGYVRISRRSGVLLQNPYPMYFYPDNLLESIIIFQKGKFNYKSIPNDVREKSKISIGEFNKKKWYLTLWEMTNVLPNASLEKGIAAFPYELPYRIISLFSYVGETVLDPFSGSGTTQLAAKRLNRNSVGYEINETLEPIIREKLGFGKAREIFENNDAYEVIIQVNE